MTRLWPRTRGRLAQGCCRRSTVCHSSRCKFRRRPFYRRGNLQFTNNSPSQFSCHIPLEPAFYWDSTAVYLIAYARLIFTVLFYPLDFTPPILTYICLF